ncbi:MAG: RnfABCDGE type electron transport complex subunit G [Proteobacteria bacterium]|nr:RnfABCDGE type electron transport complex subunit G [Pseudomonadota bacterium]
MRDISRLVIALTLVCVVAAAALAVVDKATKGARDNQDRLANLEAINAVLPEHDNEPDKDTKELEGITFYLGKKDGQVVGIAFAQVSSKGYSGDIEVMLGVNPNGELYGIDVVKHMETPGLGAKIDSPETGNKFKNQFFAKERPAPLLITSNISPEKDGGEIQAISGATISPRAVCEAVRNGVELFEKVKRNVNN